MSFQCVIVTPEQQLMDETVTQAIMPAEDGQIGILTGRAPLLAKLGLGPLRIDVSEGTRRVYLIDGGVAQMKDNRLTILTSAAWAPEQLDAAAARAEYDEAAARQPADPGSMAERDRVMRRARFKQELASGRSGQS